jgi:3-hydroxybutyryl-CoA dehydrogenase
MTCEYSFMPFLCKNGMMRLLVISSPELKDELNACPFNQDLAIEWIDAPQTQLSTNSHHACLDLLFVNDPTRKKWLKNLGVSVIIVNSVVATLGEIEENFVRVCGWPTLLSRKLVEASAIDENQRQLAMGVFASLGRTVEWVPDVCGFVGPRIISAVINEAFMALSEGVSVESEIDTAMSLGTNYPFGPFEWGQKIGFQNIYTLLEALSHNEKRYSPCHLLKDRILV